jgi:TonB family protein
VNNLRTATCVARLIAFVISLFLYGGTLWLIAFWANQWVDEPRALPVEISLNWSEAPQVEQVAVEEPPPPVEQEPPPEEVDVALEELVEEPEPEPVFAEAQVSQEASAPELIDEKNPLLAWVQARIEKEKYYPAAARRAGIEGDYVLAIAVRADGTIESAEVVSGKGHFLLRRALDKMIGALPGQQFPGQLSQKERLEFSFSFNLE